MSDELFAELFGESGSESEAHTTKTKTRKKQRLVFDGVELPKYNWKRRAELEHRIKLKSHQSKEDGVRDTSTDSEDEDPDGAGKALTEEQVMSLLHPRSSTISTRVSPFLKLTASLKYDPVTSLYLLSGRCCQHTGDQTCVALDALALTWCSELQSVIDTTQSSIVPARCLPAFLKETTKGTSVDPERLVRHLRDAYRLNTSESDEDLKLRFKSLLLMKPIPFLDQPVLRYQCSLCLDWFPGIARHRHDVKTGRFQAHPAGNIEGGPERHFILPLKSGTGAPLALQKSLKVMLASHFTPHIDLNPSRLPEASHDASSLRQLTVPSYVDSLRWSEQLEKSKESPLTFLEIKSLASGHRISKKRRQRAEKDSLVEKFLLSLPHFVREYLKGAEWRISSAHCSVRGLVTAGTKGVFRTLSDHTLDEYGMVIRSTIAFSLRWLSLQRQEQEKVSHFTRMGWKPKWLGDQLKASTDFLDALLAPPDQSNEDGYHNLVMDYIHKFLVASFSTPFIDGSGIGSIVEQTIMLASFSSTNGWQRASRIVNGPLKAWQNVSRVVSIHCAFLGGLSSIYECIIGDQKAPSGVSTEEEPNDSDDSGDSDGEEESMELLDFSVIGALAKTQSTDDAESQQSEHIVKFFESDAHVFSARNVAYQWGRCSVVWSTMLSLSKAEASATQIEWSPDSRTFGFKSSYASLSVQMDDFRRSVLKLPESIWQSFLRLFPVGYPIALLDEIETLETTAFHDDPDNPDSLFLRKDNSTRVRPYYDALKEILQPLSVTVCEQYQDALPKFQACLLHGIISCNGVSMRSAQAAELRFTASNGFPRNIYVDDTQCYVGKPVAKQKYTGPLYYEAYWLLHARIGLALLLYRLIFRPLESVLLLHHDVESLEVLDSADRGTDFIFIKVVSCHEQRQIVGWDGKDVNGVLRAAESPLRSEARVHRHFTKAVIQRFLSPQAIQISQAYSPVPERHTSFPNSRQNQKDSILRRKEQLALSTAVHQLFGLKPQPDNIASTLHQTHALQHARHLVIARYQLCGDNQQVIRDRVQHLVCTRPFMYGCDRKAGATWSTLGDRTLIEVTAETLYGPTRPSALENMPYDGYSVSPVAVALNMIWTAIHEWETGSYRSGLQFTEESTSQAEKMFFEVVNKFRLTQRLGWLDFCFEVHRHATRCLQFIDHNPLPHIVPSVKLLPLDLSFQRNTYAQIPVLTRQWPALNLGNIAEQVVDDNGSAMVFTVLKMAAKPFAVEKAWCSGTAAQHLRQLEEEVAKRLVHRNPRQQLDPPRKRRAESIPRRTDEAFERKDNSQYTDDRANKRRRGATPTEAKGTVDDLWSTKQNNGTERQVGKCWLVTSKHKSSDLRSVSLGSSGEEDSDDEKQGDRPRKPGGQCQPGVQKVTARLHLRGAAWKGNFVRMEGGDQRAIDFPSNLVQTHEIAKHEAFLKPSGSKLSVNNMATEPAPKILKAGKGLPHWVHPKWTTIFLPTLSHALFNSQRPFQEFKPSSPIFVATVQQILRLVYSHDIYVTKDDVLVEEAAQRLATKRSKIASAIMGKVKSFFEQDAYVSRPDKVKAYVDWALQPDGPAFHEAPTPITCTFNRDHQEYIHPKGTFQSPIMNSVAKHFLLQVKGSVLDPPINASNPPKGLYGLLLVSVERAFTAFMSGNYRKPKAKFSHENYRAQLETYMGHLDTMQPALWEEILYRANTLDVHDSPQSDFADNSTVSISQNLYIPRIPIYRS